MNEQGLELTVPMGVSGAYLLDKARFGQIRIAWRTFYRLRSALLEVEQKLQRCHDPEWLTAFGQRCGRSKSNPEEALTEQVNRLGRQRMTLEAEKEEARSKLLALEPRALDGYQTLAAGSLPYLHLPPRPARRILRNPAAKSRYEVIDCFLDLPNKTIAYELDAAFPFFDRPSPQLPEPWFEKYGVRTFKEAYGHKKCKHLLISMISKRRRLAR